MEIPKNKEFIAGYLLSCFSNIAEYTWKTVNNVPCLEIKLKSNQLLTMMDLGQFYNKLKEIDSNNILDNTYLEYESSYDTDLYILTILFDKNYF
jgi:hypothetical protein